MWSRLRIPLIALCLLAAAAAQPGTGSPNPSPPTVVVQNLAPHARTEWTAAVVPFARGEVLAPALPDLHAEGLATVWQPLGARWPDGSLRHALCLFRPALAALDEARIPLVAGGGPTLDDGPPPAPPQGLRITFVWQHANQQAEATLAPAEVLETNAARRVELWRARLGASGLVAEAILTAWRAQEHLDASVGVFFSDPRSEAMDCPIDRLTVRTQGVALVLRHGGRFGTRALVTAEGDGSETTLLRACRLGDGQGIRRTGVLVPQLRGGTDARDATLRATVVCPLLAATARWQTTGTWGAFGVVPDAPPALQSEGGLRAALAQRHATFVRAEAAGPADPFWCGPHGLARTPAQTGDQADFGVAKLGAVAGSGLASFLFEVEASVLQEACRPVHVFAADGAPLRAADHPDWVVWSGRTHWHCQVSSDRLGKPCPEPRFERNGWGGKDREHWSTNYAAGYYLLTGAPWLRRELENEVQLFLAGETLDKRLTTSGTGAARGAGRTLLAGCWLYLCTGDAALLQRIHDRVEKIHLPSYAFAAADAASVRPLLVCDPDPRMLDGKQAYWNPWQEAIAATGYGAVDRLSGNAAARQLARALSTNVVRHGFKLTDTECVIATAIRWPGDGTPLPAEVLARGDKADVVWSYGTAFTEWGLPAVELARSYAEADGDVEVAARAKEILARVRARNADARAGWFTRFSEWDCLR